MTAKWKREMGLLLLLYRGILYTVTFVILWYSVYGDVRYTVMFVILWFSLYRGARALWYSLYRGVRDTVVFVIVGCSLYRGVRYTVVFVIPGCYSHCDDSCYYGVRYIQGLHCI